MGDECLKAVLLCKNADFLGNAACAAVVQAGIDLEKDPFHATSLPKSVVQLLRI